ncbi:MAG: hypothetical protein M0D55_11090 [Elusimicrobiota bacterium]|nr:MAG: hypothetical protein M0D55_11090 [Elusimicrobiota bacterium]
MDARRRLGPPALALAAAAVGARLLLGPERLVGELRPGSRGADAPPPAPALASPIAWEAAAAPGTGQAAARGAAVPEPAREPSWRDAPADFRAVSYSAAGSRRPASAARSAPPAARSAELEAAPSAAELSTHEDPARASAPPRRASRDSYRRRFSGFAPRAAAAARAVRVPFALGPAEPGGDVEPEEEARAPVDPRTSPSPGGWRRLRRAFPLFRAPLRPAAAARERARRVARVKPPSLSRLLGLAALRPPPAALPVPDLSGLDAKKPLFLPGGAPVPSRLLDALALEKLDPKRHGSSRDRKRSAHWDAARPLWHDGPARGLALLSQWQWLWKDDERWWAAREPGAPPLLRWGSLWWGNAAASGSPSTAASRGRGAASPSGTPKASSACATASSSSTRPTSPRSPSSSPGPARSSTTRRRAPSSAAGRRTNCRAAGRARRRPCACRAGFDILVPMSRIAAVLLACAALAAPSRAQDAYGSRGLFPVYVSGNQWVIFDKPRPGADPKELMAGARYLIIGSEGADVFVVGRTSATYGGACRAKKPTKLRAALLKGPRSSVGDPVLAIKVPDTFVMKGSRASYSALENKVDEPLYQLIGSTVAAAAAAEAKAGGLRFRADDEGAAAFLADPRPDKVASKIDFAARLPVAGLKAPVALVTDGQISSSHRRCLRLADGDRLVGPCVEMPHDLMSETAQLRFVSYDPSGKGNPFLLAYTKGTPLWGHERWGFVLRATGPRLFLRDAMDPRCREGF